MKCTWAPLLKVLPVWLRKEVDMPGKETIREIRLRLNRTAELVTDQGSRFLNQPVTREDIQYVINGATRYSPWGSKSMQLGFVTIDGGHRIGIAGQLADKSGDHVQIQSVLSLCIRIARDIPQIGDEYRHLTGSVLILGAPGWGKTTLLRDLARGVSQTQQTVVIDDRGELFPEGFGRGKRMDVLSFCPKKNGIDMAIRNLSPETLVVDEITQDQDCAALVYAAHCGVRLLATAHAASLENLMQRKVYRPLVEGGIFEHLLVLNKERSCRVERMTSCI